MERAHIALAILGVLGSCSHHSPPSPSDPLIASALKLTQRFVSADTAGDLAAADSLWLPMEGMSYCEGAFDTYDVTEGASILPIAQDGDTVLIQVSYSVIGYGHGEDTHKVGANEQRFEAQSVVEVDTLQVAHDSTGRLGFVCDHYRLPANHIAAARWGSEGSHFDSASRIQWEAAVGRRPNKRLERTRP